MKINYSTPCSTDKLSDIRSFVTDQLANTDFSDTEKYQIVLAIDEACANAIIHGNQCDGRRRLKIEIEVTRELISVEIYDIGNYRPNQAHHSPCDIRENIRTKQKGGLGLRLMHIIMDRVRYYNNGKANVCSLVKKVK